VATFNGGTPTGHAGQSCSALPAELGFAAWIGGGRPERRIIGGADAVADRMLRTGRFDWACGVTALSSQLDAHERDAAQVLGCRIDRLDMETTVRRIRDAIDRREYVQHVSINAAKLIVMRDDEDLRRIVDGCGLANADGQAVVWASRLLGDPLPARVAGVDLMFELLALAEERGYRPYILGAAADVLEQAVERLRARHPRLDLAGWHDGYFASHQQSEVAREIRDSGADILFVAISSPAKEEFLATYGADLGVPFVMGVGGAVDIVAGVTRRAPETWQRLGVEWLYRLLQEPRRMFTRYATTNLRFIALVMRSFAARVVSRMRRARA